MPTYKYLNDAGLERALSKLKTYIDSQSGGGSDGHGFIICDTSTMQVGDRIRVRSVYTVLEEPYNQTKEVVTVGQPVVFTVPCYDYYKICTVQTINDTPTEIGGVYKTVDYGQTLFINVLDKKTLVGMQGILNSHKELDIYNIGDEIPITINDGSVRDWVMLVGAINLYDSHEIILVSKYVYNATAWYSSSTAGAYYADGTARTSCQTFYNTIVEQDRQFIKQLQKSGRSAQMTTAWKAFSDYVWIPNIREVTGQATFGTNNQSCQDSNVPKTQFPIFTTVANRLKTDENGTIQWWWTPDGWDTNDKIVAHINTSGALGYAGMTASGRILPCFRLTADS